MGVYLEILGRLVSLPDPDVADGLSGGYRAVCADLKDAKSRLSALVARQAAAEWTGPAAAAFAAKIGSLPGQLDQAALSYAAVAAALSVYAAGLRPVVTALCALASEAEGATGQLRGVVTVRQQIISQGQDRRATGWDQRLAEANASVSWAEERLSALLGDLDELSAGCVGQIRQASAEGIQNNLATDFQLYVVQDGAVAWRAGGMVLKAGAAVADDLFVRPFTKLGEDLAAIKHEGFFEALGTICADVAGVLGVLMLFVPVLGEFVAPLLVVAVASETVAAATHEQGASWGQVGSTALDLGLAGTGTIVDQGVAADDQLLQNALDHGHLQQLKSLANGTDARVSGEALLQAGTRRSFSAESLTSGWSDTLDNLKDPFGALRDSRYSLTHLGVMPYTRSPAAVRLQHVKFGLDQIDRIKTVVQAQYEKGHGQ